MKVIDCVLKLNGTMARTSIRLHNCLLLSNEMTVGNINLTLKSIKYLKYKQLADKKSVRYFFALLVSVSNLTGGSLFLEFNNVYLNANVGRL